MSWSLTLPELLLLLLFPTPSPNPSTSGTGGSLMAVSWAKHVEICLQKTNMEPKNDGLEVDVPFNNRYIWCRPVSFGGCTGQTGKGKSSTQKCFRSGYVGSQEGNLEFKSGESRVCDVPWQIPSMYNIRLGYEVYTLGWWQTCCKSLLIHIHIHIHSQVHMHIHIHHHHHRHHHHHHHQLVHYVSSTISSAKPLQASRVVIRLALQPIYGYLHGYSTDLTQSPVNHIMYVEP